MSVPDPNNDLPGRLVAFINEQDRLDALAAQAEPDLSARAQAVMKSRAKYDAKAKSFDPTDEEPPRELEPIELGGLIEMKLDKPRELVGSLVREASLGMIHAPAGVGKTFFGLGMAVSLTHGAPFLGFPVKEAFPALYVDGEMAAFDMQERLKLLSAGLDCMWKPLLVVTPDLASRGIPKIDSDEGRTALIAQLDERPEIKLVMLDNLACLTRPDGDDSHGARSFTFVQDLMLECRRRHVACWIVHHSGKNGEQRGTSKRADVLDVIVRLTPVLATDESRRCLVLMAKSAGDNELVKAAYVRNYVALNLTLEGMVLDLLRGEGLDPGAITQLMAQENGIGRILGLAERPKQTRRLHDVMRGAA